MTASFSPALFIEDALFCTTPLALSYSDPNQKWTIRQHLISLFHNCPYLRPSLGHFTHEDGVEVKLLTAVGLLPVAAAAVPVTIWVHELYPQAGPIVYVGKGDAVPSSYPIYDGHPFVDSSGNTTSSYLVSWRADRSNLTDLVRSLIALFDHNHPFYYDRRRRRCSHPSSLSKTEALDRLTCAVYYDMRAAAARDEEEIRRLAAVQVELQDRAAEVEAVIGGLAGERRALKERIRVMCEQSDKVLCWLTVYGDVDGGCVSDIDGVFEALDETAEAKAEMRAVEDVMYALDEAVGNGVLGFGEYMKQVRGLARQQFLWADKMVRIERGGSVLP